MTALLSFLFLGNMTLGLWHGLRRNYAAGAYWIAWAALMLILLKHPTA